MENKSLTWLHFSDLHLCRPETGWDADGVLKALIKDLKDMENEHGLRPDLIFFTGDAVWGDRGEESGCSIQDQFEEAFLFFEEARKAFNPEVDIENFFIVPGNHDVNRNKISSEQTTRWLRELVTGEKGLGYAKQQIISMMNKCDGKWNAFMERLADYRNFLEYAGYQHLLTDSQRMIFSSERKVHGLSVGIAGLNSAWSCCGTAEEKARLWLGGDWQLKSLLKGLNNTDIKIALIHHPINWFNEAEDPHVKRQIEQKFDFLIHGHEHQGWVAEASNHISVAAGAGYESSDKKNGYNFVRLSPEESAAEIWLREYDKLGDGWVASHIYGSTTPEGKITKDISWIFPKAKHSSKNSQQVTHINNEPESRGVYGRRCDINKITSALLSKTSVTIYGMSGIGKTVLVNELRESESLEGFGYISLGAYQGMGLPEFYRQIVPALGCRDENPSHPIRLLGKIDFSGFAKFAGKAPPLIVHIYQAHNLFSNNRFNDPDMLDFLLAIAEHAPKVKIILECREIPPKNSLPAKINSTIKIRGIDQESLKAYFQRPFIHEPQKGWTLSQIEAETICFRLSDKGKGEHRAHPLGMFLLASVADGMKLTPLKILERHENTLRDKLEESLFQDLYEKVLSDPERHVLRLSAFYRDEVPYEHVDQLNELAGDNNAFDHIVNRCLLTPDKEHEKYYLHSLIGMLTLNRINKEDDEFYSNHECIASAWLNKVKFTKRISLPQMRAASEAIYHLIEAKNFRRLQDIQKKWIGTDVLTYLVKVSSKLFKEGRHKDNFHVLNLIIAIDPDNDMAHRFLGETIERKGRRGDEDALRHHEKAYSLRPDFPQYLANLGRCLLARDEPERYLAVVANIDERIRPTVMNDYNLAIYTQCLSKLGQKEEASKIRQEHIAAGIRHPSIYTDEASYLGDEGRLDEALALLEKAEKLCASNDYTEAMLATLLDKKGETARASQIRQFHIDANSSHPVFYNEEAKKLRDSGKLKDALDILDKAKTNRATDDTAIHIRISILKQIGDNAAASKIRKDQIKSRSRTVAFYTDEAVYLRNLGKFEEALTVLEDANQLGISNEYSWAIYASILEKKGVGDEASEMRQKFIMSGSLDSVFYNDEAKYLSDKGEYDDALDLLNQSEMLGISNDYSLAIKAKILGKIGKTEEAALIRKNQISVNSQNPAFYTDEAEYLLQQMEYEKALEVLDKAERIGADNEYTKAVRAKIYDQNGQGKAASDIRMVQIKSGSLNPIFYNDEAVIHRDNGNYTAALNLLDAAEEVKATNNYSVTIRASILEKMGDGKSASELRQNQIKAKTRHPAIYNDEAVYLLDLGLFNEALSTLDEADKIGISDDHNLSIRAKILEKMGRGTAASKLRQGKIKSGSLDPVFFNDEAVYLINIGKFDEALEILQHAEIKNVKNENTYSIRASIFKKRGA